MMQNFRADFRRYAGARPTVRSTCYALTDVALWAVVSYRLGRWIKSLPLGPLVCVPMFFYFFLAKFIEIVSGISISLESEIGPGLLIHNFGGIIIRANIGAECLIVQGVHIVPDEDSDDPGRPTLGDKVYVGSSAKIVGNIRIGNNVRVGANSVVMRNVPDNSVVLPPDSQVIRGFYKARASADQKKEQPAAAAAESRKETQQA